MKTTGGTDARKRCAMAATVRAIEDGAVAGLGTGSTTVFAIRAIGDRVADGPNAWGIPTPFAARELARECDIPVVDFDGVDAIDLAIDGADQVTLMDGALVGGGGVAHAYEKVVDAFVDRLLVVADPSRIVETLSRAIPVEVPPPTRTIVAAGVSGPGGEVVPRHIEQKSGLVVTDSGNLVLGCELGTIPNPELLATDLASLPGTVEHGLFVGLVNAVYVDIDGGVEATELWFD